MELQSNSLILVPAEDWKRLNRNQEKILEHLKQFATPGKTIIPSYVSAAEYMNAVGIKRSKMENLICTNQIKSIKKGRKIYIHADEIENFFTNPNIK